MSFINNKNNYRFFLISTFILINILVLFGISEILGYLHSGADRSSMLHLDKEPVNTYLPKVVWEELNNEGRKMEPQTLQKIEKHYLFSWLVKNNALKKNTEEGIADYFTENTRENLHQIIKLNKKEKTTIECTTLAHHPKLEFYSEDGQQIVFTDKNVVEYQNIYKNNKLVSSVKDTATYKVLMLLEDGFWRVRHCVRMKPDPIQKDTLSTTGTYNIKGNQLLKNGVPFTIKGINYYPQHSAWEMFGEKYNKSIIEKDFDLIVESKLNTIRIFVPYEEFGKADVVEEKLKKLKEVISLANDKNLAVIVTLFDFYGDYSLESWTLTHRHAEKIVSELKNFDNIVAFDIKNEPDLDFNSRGIHNVKPWLESMIDVVKNTSPNQLVTIGFSNIKSAEVLSNKVDFVSYHYYENVDDFEDKQTLLEKTIKKPIVIQEFGVSSNRGFWSWFGNSNDDQAAYHKKMQAVFKKKQLAFVSWTLYDFPKVPSNVAGKWPWIKSKQKQFGFIDIDGTKKPSFLYITY